MIPTCVRGHNRESSILDDACMPLRYVCQARVKQLKKTCTVDDYIVTLPPSPAALLQTFPRIAHAAFDATNLPMSSPLNNAAVDFLESKISMRAGGRLALAPAQKMTMAGLCMPTAERANSDGGHHRCHTRAVTAVTTAATQELFPPASQPASHACNLEHVYVRNDEHYPANGNVSAGWWWWWW
jgi:hypothetical protein